MPFPWKKVKNNKITQLVNDHIQHSQKRRDGSSLVVETGFPTSLIDLFMKNREKLINHSKKKRERAAPQISPVVVVNDDDDDDQVIVASPPPPPMHHSPLPNINEIVVLESSDVDVVVDDDDKIIGVDNANANANANGILLVVAKMFLVVALASGTQKFTIGMMLSAFVLFFLEYVGKRVSVLLDPRTEVKGVLGLVVQRFRSFLRYEEVKFDQRNARIVMKMPEVSTSEIQIVEPKDNFVAVVDEIQSEKDVVDCPGFEGRGEYEEAQPEEVETENEGSKRRKSRRAKLKLKMKKLVKLKHHRKDEEEEEHPRKIRVVRRDCVVDFQEQEVDQFVSEVKSESGLNGRDKLEDAMSDDVSLGGSSYSNLEAATNSRGEEGKGVESGLIWRYFALCVIVLIGLIGDRVFALLLTLSWLFLMKLGETLPRYIKACRIVSFEKSVNPFI